MILFRVETPYQLLNAITIKHSMPEAEADLVLSAASDFSMFLPGLKQIGLFQNIYLSEDCPVKDEQIIAKLSEKPNLMKRPGDLLLRCGYEDKPYTDVYVFALLMAYNHLLYYHIASLHGAPKLHLVEEGTSSYTLSLKEIVDRADNRFHYRKYIPSKLWVENNLASVWLHQPELCVVFEPQLVRKLSPVRDGALRELVDTVFGHHTLPKQRYIFFAEPMIEENINSCDIEFLGKIADRVGKENILVKPHPRMDPFLYEAAGFTVHSEEEKSIPWEIYAFDPEVQDKVLITISSSSVFSPKFINEDYRLSAIYLQYLEPLATRFHTRRRNYNKLLSRIDSTWNSEGRNVFFPRNLDQLTMAVDYFGGRLDYDR